MKRLMKKWGDCVMEERKNENKSVLKQFIKENRLVLALICALIIAIFAVVVIMTINNRESEVQQYVPSELEDPVEKDYDSSFESTMKTKKEYTNKVVSYNLSNGEKITFGVDLDDADYLYINPVYTGADNGVNRMVFYIQSDRNDLDVDYLLTGENTMEEWLDAKNLYAYKMTFDISVPAEYVDENNFGVRWNNNVQYDGKSGEDATTHLYVRMVRYSDGFCIANLKVTISYNTDTQKFEISKIENNDVAYTKELTEADRKAIVQQSVARLRDENKFPYLIDLSEDTLAMAEDTAIVEKLPKPHYQYMYDASGNAKNTYEYMRKQDLYAVSMYVDTYGFLTFYYTYGISDNPESNVNGVSLQLTGLDPYILFDLDRLLEANPKLDPVQEDLW